MYEVINGNWRYRLPVLVVYMISRLIAVVEKPITRLFKPTYVTFLAIFHYELAIN